MVALILGFLTHQGYRIPQLASLALVSCAVLALVGMQLRSRYLAAMRRRVARRSVARSSTTFIGGKRPLPHEKPWATSTRKGI